VTKFRAAKKGVGYPQDAIFCYRLI